MPIAVARLTPLYLIIDMYLSHVYYAIYEA